MTDQAESRSPESQEQSEGGVSPSVGGDLTVKGSMVGRDYIQTTQHFYGEGEAGPYASRETYLAQLANRFRDLDFVGIPELKDRENIALQDVFIPLQAAREVEYDALNVHGDWVIDGQHKINLPQINVGGSLVIKNGPVDISYPEFQLNVGEHIIVASPAVVNIGTENDSGEVNVGSDLVYLALEGSSGAGGVTIPHARVNIGNDLYGRLSANHPRYFHYLKYLNRTGTQPSVERVRTQVVVAARDLLKEHPKVVLLGDPGSGKTTLLKHIALAFATGQSDVLGLEETRLPIFIRLYDFVARRPLQDSRGFSLVDYFRVHARESLQVNLEPRFFELELERGGCCVCLDGLDELGEPGLRREVTAVVSAMVNRYPNNRYLITSRKVGYLEAPLGHREFATLSLLPFSRSEVNTFIEKWYVVRERDPGHRRERVQHLIDTIGAETGLATLATNPLLLTIIALVHRIEAELPNERVKLYDKCVTALIETWEKVKNLAPADRDRPYYKYRRRLLEQLAFWMHSQSGEKGRTREVKVGTLHQKLVEFLLQNRKLDLDEETARQEAKEFVGMVKARTGLLVEYGEGVYAFPHLTFQEYLTACDIEKRFVHSVDALWEHVRGRWQDPHWREVILLLLGGLNRYDEHTTELTRRIVEETDAFEAVVHRNLFFAARALADHVEVDARLRRTIVDRLATLTRDGQLAGRDALQWLCRLRRQPLIPEALLDLARDERVVAADRFTAAEALYQTDWAVEAVNVMQGLVTDLNVHANVRRDGAFRLVGVTGVKAALPLLLDLIRDHDTPVHVRRDVVRKIGELGQQPDVAPALRDLLQDQQLPPYLQRDIAQALGQLGEQAEAVGLLMALAQNPTLDGSTRLDAAQAINRLGERAKAIQLVATLAENPLVEGAARCSAAKALVTLGALDRAIECLTALVRDDQIESHTRLEATRALVDAGQVDSALEQTLIAWAEDPQAAADLRLSIFKLFLQLKRMDVAARIFQAGFGSRADVSLEAVLPAVDLLLAVGRHEDALNLLTDLATRQALPAAARLNFVQKLAALGRDVAEFLKEIAGDPEADGGTRLSAAVELIPLDQAPAAADCLLALVCDGHLDDAVRGDAATRLGQLRPLAADYAQRLSVLLDDTQASLGLRSSVAFALTELGFADQAIQQLLVLAMDSSAEVGLRQQAYDRLKAMIGGVAPGPHNGWQAEVDGA